MNTCARFALQISHAQIAVFDAPCFGDFNDWTVQHSDQGFTWRPGSVSFGTLEEADRHEIIVIAAMEGDDVMPEAERVIDVPFEVSMDGKVEVASIPDQRILDLAPGLYQLRFQNMPKIGTDDPVICLSFYSCASPVFRIVRADIGLKPGRSFLLTASPA